MASEKLFKTLDDTLLKSLNIKCKREFYYVKDEERIILNEVKVDKLSTSQIYILEDSTRVWNELRRTQKLYLDIEVTMTNIVQIFYEKNKVCHPSTILGFGLEWKARESKIKYCKKLGTIDNSLDDFSVVVKGIEIENANCDIDFRWFIYISKPGKNIDELNEKYANSEGLILGKKEWWTILVSGNGSIFPIEEFSKVGDPLWSIRSSFTDWAVDEFSVDNLAITFNPAHPMYELINFGGDEFNEDLFKEVMSSALCALIIQVLAQAKDAGEYDELFKEPVEESGSILAVLRYFKTTHNFAIGGGIDEMVRSIKVFFDKEKSL